MFLFPGLFFPKWISSSVTYIDIRVLNDILIQIDNVPSFNFNINVLFIILFP